MSWQDGFTMTRIPRRHKAQLNQLKKLRKRRDSPLVSQTTDVEVDDSVLHSLRALGMDFNEILVFQSWSLWKTQRSGTIKSFHFFRMVITHGMLEISGSLESRRSMTRVFGRPLIIHPLCSHIST